MTTANQAAHPPAQTGPSTLERDPAIDKLLATLKSPDPETIGDILDEVRAHIAQHARTHPGTPDTRGEAVQDGPLAMPSTWETALAELLAAAFGCAHGIRELQQQAEDNGLVRRHQQHIFTGPGLNPFYAGTAFEKLYTVCAKVRMDHIRHLPQRTSARSRIVQGDASAHQWIDSLRSHLTTQRRQRVAVS